jgi:hypothetical protein
VNLTTVTVTGQINKPDGTPASHATLRFALNALGIVDLSLVLPRYADAVCDVNGAFTAQVVPSPAGTYYDATIGWSGAIPVRVRVVVPETNCNFSQILQDLPAATIDAAQRALLDLQAAQAIIYDRFDAATAAALAASNDATASGDSATASDLSASAALSSKDAAALSAGAALNSQNEAGAIKTDIQTNWGDKLASAAASANESAESAEASAASAALALSDGAAQVDLATTAKLAAEDARDVAVNALPKIRMSLANRISSAVISDVRMVPFEIERATIINRINGYCEVTDATGKLVEVGIYNAAYTKLSSSEVREIPSVGVFQFAIPETTLDSGSYYFGICTNSTTAQFSVNSYAGGISATAEFPAPAVAAAPTPTAVAICATLLEKDLPVTQGLFSHATSVVRAYGIDPANSQPYGWNTSTGRIAKSVNSGATWIDLMPLPSTGATTMLDLMVSDGKIYVFTSGCTLYESSDLTSSATWTDISCPTTTGLRHPTALGRPYGMAAWQGNIFIGEYSATGGEFAPDGPRILRFNLTTRIWSLSKEFSAARHVHSFFTPGSSVLWVSLGDANYGIDVGVHRLTPSNIGIGSGGNDSWTRWTSNATPKTDHYPVDFLTLDNQNTFNGETSAIGIYGTSDRPGKHLLYAKQSGVPGLFNLSAQAFRRPDGPSGETVRSLVYDPVNKNLYYWTAETTEQALYIVPPPYTQAIKLMNYPASPKLYLSRAIYSNGYIMIFDQRFSVEKFVGQ